MVSYLPILIKRNGATGSKFRPSSPCDDLKEEIVDINVILVVSVIIVINLIVSDIFGSGSIGFIDIKKLQKAINEYNHLFTARKLS